MPYKNKEKQKEYQRTWSKSRKPQDKLPVRKRNAQYVNNIKESSPCTDCGEFYPYYVMQFDHLGILPKFNNVATMAAMNYSIKRLQEEIDKCELVCANCHTKRTHIRRVSGLDEEPVLKTGAFQSV